MRKFRKFAAAFAVVYLALSAGLVAVMHRPILFGEVMRHVPDPMMMLVPFKQLWFLARAGGLKVGDPAPGFNLPTADKHIVCIACLFPRAKAGRADFRELHLTAFSPGGSRAQPTLRPVQGPRCLLRGLYSGSPPR